MIHSFKFKDIFLLLDVESGAVHVVDELIYDIVKSTEGESSFDSSVKALNGKYPSEDINEAIDELKELEDRGELNAKPLEYKALPGQGVVKAICLHVAHDCNLRCSYCFAATGEYKSGRALMPLAVGKKALDFLMEHSGSRQNLEVDFFGGEPLMNFDVVKQLVYYGRELEKKHNKKIAFTLTTNALAVNDDVVDFCMKEISNVVISIDGRKEVHDAFRKTINGGGSFDIVLPKAKQLAFPRQQQGKDYYIRGTFSRNNLDFVNDVLFLADEGFEQLSLEPVVLPEDEPTAIRQQDMPELFEQYENLADIYLQRKAEGKWFNFFHFFIDLNDGPCATKRMSGCGAGGEYIAVTPQGDIYPCHQFVGKTEFCMGSVITGAFNAAMQKKFKGSNVSTKQSCKSCWAKYYCSGGCAANAYNFNGDISKPFENACQMEKKRLECALGIYAIENLQ